MDSTVIGWFFGFELIGCIFFSTDQAKKATKIHCLAAEPGHSEGNRVYAAIELNRARGMGFLQHKYFGAICQLPVAHPQTRRSS